MNVLLTSGTAILDNPPLDCTFSRTILPLPFHVRWGSCTICADAAHARIVSLELFPAHIGVLGSTCRTFSNVASIIVPPQN